jgi:hypothetical protein
MSAGRTDNSFVEESWILIDPDTGLHVGWYFWLRVLDEVNRSSRYGSPFGLLLLEAEQRDAPARLLDEESSKIPAAVRSTDLAGRLGSGRAGVLLMEQDEGSAERASALILERLAKASPATVSWRSTLFCYPRDGAAISNLLTRDRSEAQRRQPA